MRRIIPEHSYSHPYDSRSITANELKHADRDTQIEVMRTWFYENYEDPVENTPYESAEGGYIYIWGGPYDPNQELSEEFGDLVSEETIEQLANELCDISWEWTRSPSRDADDYLYDAIVQTAEHRQSFEISVIKIEELLKLNMHDELKKHLLRLLYVNAITAIETYLSDFFISRIENDEILLRKFIETTPEFKNQKITVSEIFKERDKIEERVRKYLQNIMWHNLAKVNALYKDTLDICFMEDMGDLYRSVLIRHDLVHRSGKAKEGKEHVVSEETVEAVINHAKLFVNHIDNQWTEMQSKKSVDGNAE